MSIERVLSRRKKGRFHKPLIIDAQQPALNAVETENKGGLTVVCTRGRTGLQTKWFFPGLCSEVYTARGFSGLFFSGKIYF